MRFYMIVDNVTGNVWSRNRWGTPTSTPDLYQTIKNAEYQLSPKGKIGMHNDNWRAWGHPHRVSEPQIVEVELNRVGGC